MLWTGAIIYTPYGEAYAVKLLIRDFRFTFLRRSPITTFRCE